MDNTNLIIVTGLSGAGLATVLKSLEDFGFEAFDNLVESGSMVVFDHLNAIVPMLAEVMMNTNIDTSIREKSSMLAATLIENKPGKIVKHNFVPLLLQCCFSLVVEPCEENEDVMTPDKMSVEILDALASHTPKQQVFSAAMNHASQLISSDNPYARRGGLTMIAALTEGLAELMLNDVQQLITVACKSVQDPSELVRGAAVEAIIMMSDHLQPDILDFHELILPACFAMLDNAQEQVRVKKKVCLAVDAFCTEIDKDVLAPYIDQLMKRMLSLLTSGEQVLQQTAISAIKSCANIFYWMMTDSVCIPQTM